MVFDGDGDGDGDGTETLVYCVEFYRFCDELLLILALFKLYSQVFACLQLLLQAACKQFCRVFEINCN